MSGDDRLRATTGRPSRLETDGPGFEKTEPRAASIFRREDGKARVDDVGNPARKCMRPAKGRTRIRLYNRVCYHLRGSKAVRHDTAEQIVLAANAHGFRRVKSDKGSARHVQGLLPAIRPSGEGGQPATYRTAPSSRPPDKPSPSREAACSNGRSEATSPAGTIPVSKDC